MGAPRWTPCVGVHVWVCSLRPGGRRLPTAQPDIRRERGGSSSGHALLRLRIQNGVSCTAHAVLVWLCRLSCDSERREMFTLAPRGMAALGDFVPTPPESHFCGIIA
jgi:hypothetical protein